MDACLARDLPVDVAYGQMTSLDYPYATIKGHTFHFAPGCTIRNERNLIVVPQSAPRAGAVLFRLDPAGDLIAVWVLTADEAAAAKARRAP